MNPISYFSMIAITEQGNVWGNGSEYLTSPGGSMEWKLPGQQGLQPAVIGWYVRSDQWIYGYVAKEL